MRPQVISKTTKHYDALINAIEAEGLSVIPAIATLMDNREAVSKFFVETGEDESARQSNRFTDRVQFCRRSCDERQRRGFGVFARL